MYNLKKKTPKKKDRIEKCCLYFFISRLNLQFIISFKKKLFFFPEFLHSSYKINQDDKLGQRLNSLEMYKKYTTFNIHARLDKHRKIKWRKLIWGSKFIGFIMT